MMEWFEIVVTMFFIVVWGGLGVFLTCHGLYGMWQERKQEKLAAARVQSKAAKEPRKPPMEDSSLKLLTPAPQERLQAWLEEFYGKPVKITKREKLRHRDLSVVERLHIADALPSTLIYKQVLPPWDIEQDLHERILIPSVSNSARLFLAGHYGEITALFIEDLGEVALLGAEVDEELARKIGHELAKLHRAYTYRIEELLQLNVLPSLLPMDYVPFAQQLVQRLREWRLVDESTGGKLVAMVAKLADKLAGEPVSLVHGDLYAENILLGKDRFYIIDWSWFTMIGVPIIDLATLTMNHFKNANFANWRETVIDAYCFESGRDVNEVKALLPYAELLSRFLFLNWLIERRGRGIMGTTVGPVDGLIPKVVAELLERAEAL